MKDILIVEDQKDLAELLAMFLEKEGYSVCCVHSGEEALEFLEKETIKLMILDIALPEMDGFTVCQKVRRWGNIPILILSARVGKDDKLQGFQLGADDYMEKPVDPDLLIAKVRAVLQRAYGVSEERSLLISGEITVDCEAHKVYKENELIELNVKEYELLLLLLKNAGKTLNKDYIFNEIWGADSFSENQTLTVHIKRLRDKIEKDPKRPERIKTIWGIGYCYEEV